jgi:hypothetical protein
LQGEIVFEVFLFGAAGFVVFVFFLFRGFLGCAWCVVCGGGWFGGLFGVRSDVVSVGFL